MGFREALRTCLVDKYATFSGRAPRSEYWFFVLFYVLVMLVFGFLLGLFLAFGGMETFDPDNLTSLYTGKGKILVILYLMFAVAILIPSAAVTVRRFHDVNLSGWWYLPCFLLQYAGYLYFLPHYVTYAQYVTSFAVVVVTVWRGTSGENRYGADPLVKPNVADVFA